MLTTMNHDIYYIITVIGTGIRAPGFRKPGNQRKPIETPKLNGHLPDAVHSVNRTYP
jgi:hypothetical protein